MSGRTWLITGRSQSGKSSLVAQLLAKKKYQIVWDSKDQFNKIQGYTAVYSLTALHAMIQNKGVNKIALVSKRIDRASFNLFCGMAYHWCKSRPGSALIAEELADVSQPGKASQYWGQCLRKLLGYNVDMYGITQRVAESDKTILGNCTDIVTFALSRGADRKLIASEMDIQTSEIPSENLGYVHKNMLTQAVIRGTVAKGKTINYIMKNPG